MFILDGHSNINSENGSTPDYFSFLRIFLMNSGSISDFFVGIYRLIWDLLHLNTNAVNVGGWIERTILKATNKPTTMKDVVIMAEAKDADIERQQKKKKQ
jgi:hypothetical protein